MNTIFSCAAGLFIRSTKQLLRVLLTPEQRVLLKRFLQKNLFSLEPTTKLSSNDDQLSVIKLKEEISRISSAILPNLQKPFIQLEDGETLESVIRNAFDVPIPTHFMLGEGEVKFPELNSTQDVVRKYINDRCPRIDEQLRVKLSAVLFKLLNNSNLRQDSEVLLKYAPGEGISKYQFEWFMAHMGTACIEEQLKVQYWIELSLEDDSQYLCSLFLAFNFDTFIISRLSHLLNGHRYSQIGLPSPFVYMMV